MVPCLSVSDFLSVLSDLVSCVKPVTTVFLVCGGAVSGTKYLLNKYSIELMYVLVTQSYPTPCDPMDCSLPGSSIHGILQARIPEWVAISFSKIDV